MCPCLSSPGLHRLHRQRRRLGEAHDRAWRGCRGRQGSGLGFARHVGLCVVATGLILSRPPSPFRAVAAPLPASSLFCVAVCSSVGCTCPLWLWDPARRPHIPTDVSTCELARFRCWRSDQKRNPFDYVEGCITTVRQLFHPFCPSLTRLSQLCATLHTPCDMCTLVPRLVGS